MSEKAGSADVPVGSIRKEADGDVGAPGVVSNSTGEWYSRGYLPHRNSQNVLQSITFRLADSLPQTKLKQLEVELKLLPVERQEPARRKQIEKWLDAGMGCCALAQREVAEYVQNSLRHFHRERYTLHAWCIMPNHVHTIIQPHDDLATIIQGWKSYTARWVLKQNQRLQLQIPKSNQLWMREYWDRYIRDSNHYLRAVDYIHENPVQARLCASPADWPWSSAAPGNADVPVGSTEKEADEDVGAPSRNRSPDSSIDK